MRRTCLDQVYRLARTDERIVFLGSDITRSSTLARFREEMPDRFFMEGVSEGNLVGVMAGLAMAGRIPYLNTIATFATRRCFDQLAIDACLHRFPLRILGSGGGLVYAPLGPTHLAIEDLALMRCLPGMAVVAPADAREMERLMPATVDWPGPLYVRIAKGGDPLVTPEQDGPYPLGRAFPMREGGDVLLVTTGILLGPALQAADALAGRGLRAGVLHVPTVKPLDVETLLEMAAPVPLVVTAEEHTVLGGLGSAVAEALSEGLARPPRVRRLGLPDEFPHHYGLDAEGLESTVSDLLAPEA